MKKNPIKFNRILPLLAAMLMLLGAATKVQAAGTAYTFNVTSGSWNTAANWSPSGIPGGNSADTATIPTGKTVTGLGGTSVSITTLTIQGTGILNIDSSSTLNVSGVFTLGNSASVAYLTNSGTLNLNGTGTSFICDASVLTNTVGSTFICAGGNTGNANDASPTFGNNGTATFTGSTAPFSTGNKKFLVVNGPNGVLNLNNSGASFGNSAQATFTATGNTVNYGFAGAQSPVGGGASISAYYNLTLSGSGAKTTGAATVNGTCSLQGTATMNSTVTYGSGAALAYAGSSAQTATANEFPSSSGPANLTINNTAGVTLGIARTITGTLTLTSGTFTLSSVLTLGNGANIIRTSGSLSTAPTFGTSVNVTYNNTSSTTTGFELPTSTTVLNNLTISNLAGVVLNANAKVNGTFAATYNGSTVPLAAGANTLTFASSPVNITVIGSALAATAYTIVSSSGSTVSGALGTLTVGGSGVNGTATIADTSGQLILTVASGGSSTISYSGTLFIYNGTAQSPAITFNGSTGAMTTNYVGTNNLGAVYSSVSAPTNAGGYTVSNTVAANGGYSGAINSQSFTIAQATNALALSSSVNPSTSGVSVTFTASVQTNGVITMLATSNVVFSVTNNPVVTNALSGGQAAYSSTFTTGIYLIKAVFGGDNNFQPSTNTLTQTVNAPIYTLNITNATSGAWTNPATWVSGQIPMGTNNVYILGGTTVTSLGANESCSNLSILDSGSLNIESTYELTVSNALTMGSSGGSGVANLTNNGTLNVNGTGSIFVFNDGSVLTNTTGSTFTCAGGNSANANASPVFGNNGNATFTGATIPFDTGFHNFTVIQGPDGILNLNNSVAAFGNSATLNATAVGNTVNYGYAGSQSVATQSGTATYYNLTLSGSGSKTGSATISANGTLSLQGTTTVGNTITYGSGATLVYAGSAQQTSSANELPSGGVPNLTINNGSGVLLGGNSSVTNLLALAAGVLNLNGHTLSAVTVTSTTGSILLTPTLTLNNKVYDGTPTATVIATRSLAGILTGDSGNVTLGTSGTVSAFSSANVGSYTPSVTGLTLSGTSSVNYSLSTTSVSPGAIITKATASVTVTPYSVTYDGNAHMATAGTITGVNGETGATVGTVTLSGTTHTVAGSYTSDFWTLTGGANYNNIGSTTITDTIGKATASVTVTPYSVTYDGNAHTAMAGTVTGVNGETGATVGTVTLSGTTHTVAGSYTSDSWTLTGGANYNNIGSTTITDTIGKATASVTVTPYSVTYDGNAHTAMAGTVTGVNGETGATVGTVTLSGTTHTVAGSYTSDSWTLTGGANYNNIGSTTITDTINTLPITMTAQTNIKDYDGTTSATNVPTLTSGALASGDDFATLAEVYADVTVGTGKTLIPSATVTNSSGADVTASYAITFVDDLTGVINSDCTAPTIVGGIDPGSLTVTVGSQVILTLTNNTGSSPLAYQWLSNTVAIADATNSSYTNLSVTVADAGNYQVVVTNNCGSVTSGIAVVTVNPQTPIIWTAPTAGAAITYGQSLAAAGLTGGSVANAAGAALSGSFAYTSPSTTPSAGTYPESVIFTPTDTNNYNSVSTTVSVTVNQASISVAVASSENPSGYHDSISFTAMLPSDATGSVIFSSTNGPVSTNTVSVGSTTSLSITNLPRGTNLITFIYSGDSNYIGSIGTLDQVVTNHPPTANNASYTRNAAVNSFKIPVSNLLTNVTDVDGDTLTLASVSATTNNAIITISGGYVLYSNNNAVTDEFTYTVSDGFGGTNSATVTINVDSTPLFGQSEVVSTTGGSATLNFAGIPGYSYSVARSTDLSTWLVIWTTNAPAGGVFTFTDTNAPLPTAFYQLQFNP